VGGLVKDILGAIGSGTKYRDFYEKRAIDSAEAWPKLYRTVSVALALILSLAEALAASEPLEKAHLIRRVTHYLCRGPSLTRFRHRPRPT